MPNLVEVNYQQTGRSTNADALGMREMQARAYAARDALNHSSAHIVAMTGSYFRGDSVPVLEPEDEARFPVVEEAIELILSGKIVDYIYDDELKVLCRKED